MSKKLLFLLLLFSLFLFTSPALSSTPNKSLSPQGTLATGLTGWWKFDDTAKYMQSLIFAV